MIAPAPREVSFGYVTGLARAGTERILVSVAGRRLAEKPTHGPRFSFTVALPRQDVTVKVTAVDALGRRATTVVGPVYGLPRSAPPAVARRGYEDPALARRLNSLARRFPGTCAVFVQDLRTGAGAAWNARARFPAASTLKLAIAVEVLRVYRGKPPPGSEIEGLLQQMLVASDAKAANALLVWLGGSTSAGGARVDATLRALGLFDTEMYGGYEIRKPAAHTRRPIPLRIESAPSFGVGKYTTAWDLARLMHYLHLAAEAKGLLVHRFRGEFTPSDARFLLYVLAHVGERGRLDRYLSVGGAAVLQKAGWIDRARHDNGLVYWPGGAFVVTVLTWNPRGAGLSSDVLAGKVARTAFDRFRRRS